jgi:hypothetical protein
MKMRWGTWVPAPPAFTAGGRWARQEAAARVRAAEPQLRLPLQEQPRKPLQLKVRWLFDPQASGTPSD